MDMFFISLLFVILSSIFAAAIGLTLLVSRYRKRLAEVGLPPNRYALRLAKRLQRWGRKLENRLTPPSERLLIMSHGHLVSQYLLSVVRLGVADAGAEAM